MTSEKFLSAWEVYDAGDAALRAEATRLRARACGAAAEGAAREAARRALAAVECELEERGCYAAMADALALGLSDEGEGVDEEQQGGGLESGAKSLGPFDSAGVSQRAPLEQHAAGGQTAEAPVEQLEQAQPQPATPVPRQRAASATSVEGSPSRDTPAAQILPSVLQEALPQPSQSVLQEQEVATKQQASPEQAFPAHCQQRTTTPSRPVSAHRPPRPTSGCKVQTRVRAPRTLSSAETATCVSSSSDPGANPNSWRERARRQAAAKKAAAAAAKQAAGGRRPFLRRKPPDQRYVLRTRPEPKAGRGGVCGDESKGGDEARPEAPRTAGLLGRESSAGARLAQDEAGVADAMARKGASATVNQSKPSLPPQEPQASSQQLGQQVGRKHREQQVEGAIEGDSTVSCDDAGIAAADVAAENGPLVDDSSGERSCGSGSEADVSAHIGERAESPLPRHVNADETRIEGEACVVEPPNTIAKCESSAAAPAAAATDMHQSEASALASALEALSQVPPTPSPVKAVIDRLQPAEEATHDGAARSSKLGADAAAVAAPSELPSDGESSDADDIAAGVPQAFASPLARRLGLAPASRSRAPAEEARTGATKEHAADPRSAMAMPAAALAQQQQAEAQPRAKTVAGGPRPFPRNAMRPQPPRSAQPSSRGAGGASRGAARSGNDVGSGGGPDYCAVYSRFEHIFVRFAREAARSPEAARRPTDPRELLDVYGRAITSLCAAAAATGQEQDATGGDDETSVLAHAACANSSLGYVLGLQVGVLGLQV